MGELKLKKLLTAEELAEVLGLNIQHVWKLARQGKIKKVPGMGRLVRFNPDLIERTFFSQEKVKR